MAGHIDEADRLAAAQRRIGKAQVDGEAAALLFSQAVGVHAGEGAHQAGLAVVDMAGGGDDHGQSR